MFVLVLVTVTPNQQYYAEALETVALTGIAHVVHPDDKVGFVTGACGSAVPTILGDILSSDGNAIVDFSSQSDTFNVCICDWSSSANGLCDALTDWVDATYGSAETIGPGMCSLFCF